MIQRDDHDVAELTQRLAIVGVRLDGGAVCEPAAVHPHHDRLLRRRREVLRPDVQYLAVLVLDPVAMREQHLVAAHARGLRNRADRAKRLCALDAFPRLDRLRQLESLRLRVLDAEEREGLPVAVPAELSAGHLDDGRIHVRGSRSGCGRGSLGGGGRLGFRCGLCSGCGETGGGKGCAAGEQTAACHSVRGIAHQRLL